MTHFYTVVYLDLRRNCTHIHRSLKQAVSCAKREAIPCDILRVELRPLTPSEKAEVMRL